MHSQYIMFLLRLITSSLFLTDSHSDDASASSPTVILANARTITFAAQAAVMSQLVFNAQEGASHTFIHI